MIVLENKGIILKVPTGFSWTTLFFGPIPALLRGDILWGIGMILVSIITGGLSLVVFPFIYNKIYIKALIEKGYEPFDRCDKEYLIRKNIYNKKAFTMKDGMYFYKNINESNVDELIKWRDLYERGAITKDEYEKKKKELL